MVATSKVKATWAMSPPEQKATEAWRWRANAEKAKVVAAAIGGARRRSDDDNRVRDHPRRPRSSLRSLRWRRRSRRRRGTMTSLLGPKRVKSADYSDVGHFTRWEMAGNGQNSSRVTLVMRQGACRLTSGKATTPMSPFRRRRGARRNKDYECDGDAVAFRRRQTPCRLIRTESGLLSELRSRLGWAVVRAIYDGFPDFQRRRLEGMGFGPFLRLEELTPDVALIQALKERWNPECHAFLFPWGHMIPTLEDLVRITGLCVGGQAVTGTTYTSYQEPVERFLSLEVRGERSSLVQQTALQASLGVANARHQTGESQAEYMARLTEDARAGAALLAHLFDSLGTSSRETGVAGFFPLLQVWAYYHLPSLGRGRWRFCRDERSLRRQVTLIHDILDTIPFGHVRWIPYVGESDAAQPWVERDRPYFGRDIWLHCFNTVVPLHHRLVARTLGLHQVVVEFPTQQRPWKRPGRSFRGIQQVTDWTVRVREQLDDWEQRGREVASEATSDEDYFRAYARRYGAQVYKGTRRPLDPEGRITSLEGILHSTIQQCDDLQAVVDQLRAELERAQQMVGGTSSSREDPGCSVLEGQLASAVARAEDALSQLQEQEAELRVSLARTTALETEMAELRLRPATEEVVRWREAAEEATRWRQEAAEAARWCQEAEEAA
ncbi:hypothetical protein Taro_020951 [Colocasia esculenta]|uniref:Aminotransferase-like plant mobile domain-containing protein n=1 Tax=Colocasia esculenta TaxID=4460 RepID=A0A843V3W1_COLES|nr:hypothetical protein [Colocasia esculenta]